jgi:hypothetical protein
MKKTPQHFLFLAFGFLFQAHVSAQQGTQVFGNVSGTWNTAGSPYIATANCIVPNGQTLTIEPGVTVIISNGTRISVEGTLTAIGTRDKPIFFKAPNNTTYWDRILILYTGNKESQFEHCDFSNARVAIAIRIYQTTGTIRTLIKNCHISNCLEAGIYGESEAGGLGYPCYCPLEPHLNPTITNCIFSSCLDAINIKIWGGWFLCGTNCVVEYRGHAALLIENNLFKNLRRAALSLTTGDYAGSSAPIFTHNTVVNSPRGVFTPDPYNSIVESNIFFKTDVAVERRGNLSLSARYNCFFDNASANFIGYSPSYGDVNWQNRNGDPSDLSFNIFMNPEFTDSTLYTIAASSPCINAGAADSSGKPTHIGANTNLGTAVEIVGNFLPPKRLLLLQNYPNPFNPVTEISYQLPVLSDVELIIFDAVGQRIRTLISERQDANHHSVKWDGRNDVGIHVSSGVYVCRLKAGRLIEFKSMLLLR